MTADLRRFYQVRLSHVETGEEDLYEVADMVALMPRGGAIGEWIGGASAITAEVEAMDRVEYAAIVPHLPKNSKVKPRGYPDGIRAIEAREAIAREKQQRTMRQLRAQRARSRG